MSSTSPSHTFFFFYFLLHTHFSVYFHLLTCCMSPSLQLNQFLTCHCNLSVTLQSYTFFLIFTSFTHTHLSLYSRSFSILYHLQRLLVLTFLYNSNFLSLMSPVYSHVLLTNYNYHLSFYCIIS